MPFKKGEGGRPVGVQNKAPKALKEMILAALDRAGGVNYLLEQARANPAIFCTLVGKVLPLQLANHEGGELTIKSIVHNHSHTHTTIAPASPTPELPALPPADVIPGETVN